MTLTKVFQIFDILQDKYGAPYFPNEWKVDLFNMGQNEYLHDLLPEEGGEGVNFDFDSNVTNNIQPLIWTVSLSMNGSGVVTNTALNAAIQSASSDATATFFRIMSIGATSGSSVVYPVRYVKQNNLRIFQANTFKAPSAPSKIRYNFVGNGLQFYPTTTTPLSITVIKTPKNVAISPNVDPEWSDYVCYNIIAKMIKLSGITTESPELINDVRMAAIAQ